MPAKNQSAKLQYIITDERLLQTIKILLQTQDFLGHLLQQRCKIGAC
jgi:hypothetical protein